MKEIRYKFTYGDWYEGPHFPIHSDGWSSKESAESHIAELKIEGWDGFSDIEPYEVEIKKKININNVNRVEIIGKNGREFVKYLDNVEFHLQDDGRTLKIIEK